MWKEIVKRCLLWEKNLPLLLPTVAMLLSFLRRWSSVSLSLCIINPPTLRNRQKLQKLSESWWNPWHRPWWTYFKRQFDFDVNVNDFLFCWAWPYGMRRCPGDSSHCLRLPSQCHQRTECLSPSDKTDILQYQKVPTNYQKVPKTTSIYQTVPNVNANIYNLYIYIEQIPL